MRWLGSIFARRRRYEDISVSIREHLEERIDELVGDGMPRAEAEQAARREFGNVTLTEERSREAWQWRRLEALWADARYALRQMRRSPGYAAGVVGTLALGIGAAAAMFTVVDHVLLRPTMYRDAGRLVALQETNGTSTTFTWPAPWLDIADWRAQSRSFSEIAYSSNVARRFTLGRSYLVGQSTALEVGAQRVSANLFTTLGVQPELGRGFSDQTESATANANAGEIVLSDAIWRQVFGGDRNILGKAVRINDTTYTVAGVMPPGFRYPVSDASAPQVWVSDQLSSDDMSGRQFKALQFTVLARLRPGVSVASAQAEMTLIQKRVAAEYTDETLRKDHSAIRVLPYSEMLVSGDVRRSLVELLGASGVLWLIALVNAASLMLARGSARQREMAMRGALGASRMRLMQQMLVEATLLSAAAGALGIGLALGLVKLLAHELSQALPLPAPATVDGWVLPALVAMTAVSALLSAVWPALLAARAPIEPALRQGGVQAGTGRRQNRLRGALVVAEISMSLVLLVVCGLLLRSIYALRHVDPGFRTDHIVVVNLAIPSYRFDGQNLTQALYEPLLERVQRVSGVESAGLITQVPLGKTFVLHLEMQLSGRSVMAFMKAVSPEMQKVFGFQMAAGRYFGPQDTAGSEPVLVVNQAFARAFSPDKQDPAAVVGQQMMSLRKNVPFHVIGVLDDERQRTVAEPATPEIEIAIPQITPESGFYQPIEGVAMDLAVRTSRPTAEMIPALRAMLRQASPELENATITTMDQIAEDSYGSQRLAAHLLEVFGGAALLLCLAGLYALLAYVVTQRTREMGVRIALGATRGSLLGLVLRQAAAMLLVGVAVGAGLALAAGRLVSGFLYGVSAHDGWTLAGAAVLLLAGGLLAAYLPARRAANANPMEALRAE
jgi:predicted permease